jgi:hypothetical protein
MRARVTTIGRTGRTTTDAVVGRDGDLRITVPLANDSTPGTTRVIIRLLPGGAGG